MARPTRTRMPERILRGPEQPEFGVQFEPRPVGHGGSPQAFGATPEFSPPALHRGGPQHAHTVDLAAPREARVEAGQ